MPRPRLRTGVPRRSPSVGFMAMARTRLSPMCWATSATTTLLSPPPPPSMVNSNAKLISGRASGGNSTSTTGPAMATIRPSFSCDSWGGVSVTAIPLFLALASLGQRLGAAHDLHDLGGDGLLPGPVGDALQGPDQLVGVVGGRLHGPLP